ncbi:MAG: NADAR family protein [Moorellaceae bacterium]
MTPIVGPFRGEYAFFSNFYPALVEFEGITFPTVEHAFQAAKTLDTRERRRIALLPTPSEAKRAGRRVKLRGDWESVNVPIMYSLVYQKFTRHPELRAALLATGDRPIVEVNTWGDTFWGVCDGQGENYLVRILMAVREKLKFQRG